MRLNVCLAALAATLVASPAFAQAVPTATDTTSATARGVVLQSHKLTKNTDLYFGVVTTDGTNAGTVVVPAALNPTRTQTGGVILLPSTPTAAEFDGLAAPDEMVALTLTPPVSNVLVSTTNANDKITVNKLTLDALGASRQADSTGAFTVYVGGEFALSATQPAGTYSAQFQLTADYQ